VLRLALWLFLTMLQFAKRWSIHVVLPESGPITIYRSNIARVKLLARNRIMKGLAYHLRLTKFLSINLLNLTALGLFGGLFLACCDTLCSYIGGGFLCCCFPPKVFMCCLHDFKNILVISSSIHNNSHSRILGFAFCIGASY
jgi:hypothetical protein